MNNDNDNNHLDDFDTEDEVNLRSSHHKSPHPILRTIFFWFLLSLIVLGIYGGRFILEKYNSAHKAADSLYLPNSMTKARNVKTALKQGRPVSILLLGTDTGALGRNFRGRTDTMILAILNPRDKKMTLISLPRDEAVSISGYEDYAPTKLNAAYFFGGSNAAVRTVQQDLNVPIDFFALVNMGGLEHLIDAVNGVNVKPNLSFSYGGYSFTQGKDTLMNGKKALAYVRMRHDDPNGDYGRQERQRQVLMQLAFDGTNFENLTNQKFLNSLSKQMQTDLTFDDMLLLGSKYRVATHNMDSDHLQGTSDMLYGESFEVPSKKEKQRITNKARKALELKPAKTGSTTGKDYHINTQIIDPDHT